MARADGQEQSEARGGGGPAARTLRALLAAAALLANLPGCGDAPPPATSFTRLPAQLAAGSEPLAEAATVARFDVLDGSSDWLVEAPQSAPAYLSGESRDDSRRVLRLTAERTNQLVRVTRRGAFDGAGFNEVRVPIALSGHGAVRIEFHRDGDIVSQTDATLLHSGVEPVLVTVPIPLEVRAEGPFDALALRLDGDARTYLLRGFELRLVAPAALLPDPAQPPALVLVGAEARRGVGVATGRAVESRITVPPGGRLQFSCAVPPAARVAWPSELQVSVAAPGREAARTRVAFTANPAAPSRWQSVRVPLEDFAGESVVVRFEMPPPVAAPAGTGAGCVVAELALCRPADPARQRRPDVLLITTDTHRGDHLGAARSGVVLDTPALDALAARGLIFTDCDAPTNVTNPSHIALMTGVHPRDTGILDNATALAEAAPTLAEAFADGGYLTWAVLSTEHLGPRGSGLGQGFDRASWPPHVPRPARESVDLAERWLPDRDGRPLFLWLHVFDAHWKYEPPPDFDRRYYPAGRDPEDPDLPLPDVPPGVLPPDMADLRDLEFPRAQYRAEIAAQDRQLARLLEAPAFRDALVAVVGDHGESLGEHGIWFNHDGLYPEVLHIPLLLAGPGLESGLRVEAPVTHLDLGRTLLDLAGLRGSDFPGRALPGTAAGAAVSDEAPRFALATDGLSASVSWRGKLLLLQLRPQRSPRMERAVAAHATELYDLSADPACAHDLLDAQAELARTLRRRLIDWLLATQDRGWGSAPSVDPAALERLTQLGYTGSEPRGGARALWVDDDCDWCRKLR